MKAWSPEELESLRVAGGRPYLEFLREASMSVGLYALPAGGTDRSRRTTRTRSTS